MKKCLLPVLFILVLWTWGQSVKNTFSIPHYRKHRVGFAVEAGGSFLRPLQRTSLAAGLDVCYPFDIGQRWILEPGAGISLISCKTRQDITPDVYEDSTVGINTLSIPLRVRYMLPRWNLAPSIALSYERLLVTNILIDSVAQGANGRWFKEDRYNEDQGIQQNNIHLLVGLTYLATNRRAGLGIVYKRNLFDWAAPGFPDAIAWQLLLRVEVAFGLEGRQKSEQ